MNQTNNQPVKEFRARGGVKVAIWRNEEQQPDGSTRVSYSIKPQRSYRKKDGSWETTDYYRDRDLPHLRMLIDKAFEYTSLVESQEAAEDSEG